MANKYANLIGTNLIKDEYTKINTGFDGVETDIATIKGEGWTDETIVGNGSQIATIEQDLDNHETAADPHDQYALDTDLATLQTEVEAHKAENVTQVGGVHGIEIENGTWTPSLAGATLDVVYAAYTKIGNLIKLQCVVNVTVKGTSFTIRGIPFVGVSKTSYGKYINYVEPLETQQTYYARIDSLGGGGRLGIFCSNASGAIAPLIPSVGTFIIDIIYNID